MSLIQTVVTEVETFLGFTPEIHGNADVSTEGAAVLPDPVHRDQEMQPGQSPGMAIPATHPSHFTPSGPNHPAGPWSPTLGVGESAAHGVIQPPVDEALLERPFHSAHLHDAHLAPTPTREGPEPIPVRVIPPDTGSNSWIAAAAGTLTVSDQAQQLLPRNTKRSRVLIFNEGAAGVNVRIAFDAQTAVGDPVGTLGQGFLLLGGSSAPLELFTANPIYVVNAKTGAAQAPQVSFLHEYGVTGPVERPVTAQTRHSRHAR